MALILLLVKPLINRLQNNFIATRWILSLLVKGKRHSVKIYELIAAKTTLLPAKIQQFCIDYTAGLEAYLRQDWSTALAIFYDLRIRFPTDKSVQLFISRCQEFQLFPYKLPPDWNGVATLTDK